MEVKSELKLEIPLNNVVVEFETLPEAEGFFDWLMDEEANEQGKGGKAIFDAWWESHKKIYLEMGII